LMPPRPRAARGPRTARSGSPASRFGLIRSGPRATSLSPRAEPAKGRRGSSVARKAALRSAESRRCSGIAPAG
jgi:hypothetical protein